MSSKLVIILMKYPEVGKVKTRLAKTIGFEKATLIQKKFISKVLNNNYFKDNKNYDLKICLSPGEKKELFSEKFMVNNSDIFSVNNGNLGNVMSDIFEYGLKQYKEVILIGSDIPSIIDKDFINGFNFLKTKDLVLGPAIDGGYYLIGMKQNNKCLFENITFSTETVLKETIEKCKTNNLSFGLLDKKQDIDTYEDLINEASKNCNGFINDIINELNLIDK